MSGADAADSGTFRANRRAGFASATRNAPGCPFLGCWLHRPFTSTTENPCARKPLSRDTLVTGGPFRRFFVPPPAVCCWPVLYARTTAKVPRSAMRCEGCAWPIPHPEFVPQVRVFQGLRRVGRLRAVMETGVRAVSGRDILSPHGEESKSDVPNTPLRAGQAFKFGQTRGL